MSYLQALAETDSANRFRDNGSPGACEAIKKSRRTAKKTPATLTSLDVEVQVKGLCGIIDLKQVYVNGDSETVDIEYMFPILSNSTLVDLIVSLDGKVFQGVVGEKNKVQSRTNELNRAGIPNVSAEIFDKFKDLVKLSVGSLEPGKEMTVQLKFTVSLIVLTSKIYRLLIPIAILPRYLQLPEICNSTDSNSSSSTSSSNPRSKLSDALKFSLNTKAKMNLKVIIFKEPKEGEVLFSSPSIDEGFIEQLGEANKCILQLKPNSKLMPNSDIEFIIQRSSKLDLFHTIDDLLVRDEIMAKVYSTEASPSTSQNLKPSVSKAAIACFMPPKMSRL